MKGKETSSLRNKRRGRKIRQNKIRINNINAEKKDKTEKEITKKSNSIDKKMSNRGKRNNIERKKSK